MPELDGNVSILYAVLKGDDINVAPLILLQFHKKFETQLFHMDKKETIDLHNLIKKNHLYHGGFDLTCRCGHLALCFLGFVHHSGNFLQKGQGIKFVEPHWSGIATAFLHRVGMQVT